MIIIQNIASNIKKVHKSKKSCDLSDKLCNIAA